MANRFFLPMLDEIAESFADFAFARPSTMVHIGAVAYNFGI